MVKIDRFRFIVSSFKGLGFKGQKKKNRTLQDFDSKSLNKLRRLYIVFFTLFSLCEGLQGQNLFFEECIVGGVTAAGRTGSLGPMYGKFQIHWNPDFELKKAFAFTYRYGRPVDNQIILNGVPIPLNCSSQIGNEQPDAAPIGQFAVHGIDITNSIEISDDSISVILDAYDGGDPINTGWWSVMCVFIYESPETVEPVCLRIYTADRTQFAPQEYTFSTPTYDDEKDFGFSIYSDRVGSDATDRSIIGINSNFLGNIGGSDATNPMSGFNDGGVRGHFFYENGELFGLDDDVPNESVDDSDGIAVINEFLINDDEQELYLSALSYPSSGRFNPHPAFFLTYTPDCSALPDLGEVPRRYTFCRGDTVQITTTDEYENFEWSEAAGLSDSTVANPLCFADSSGWYTVKMWNEAQPGCSQTLPIFIEVNDIPRPGSLNITPSACPQNSGQIQISDIPGKAPFTRWLNDEFQASGTMSDLVAETYDLRIHSAVGCVWDTTLAVPLDPFQEASFVPNPETGFSPLEVFFDNTSTQATDYQWLINGIPISTNENLLHTFADSGSYEISLIAYRLDSTCADTASFSLRVEPGIRILMPNIISPNGDGRNDRLVAQVQGLTSCRWVIYNRWGNEVASGAEKNPFQEVEIWNPGDEITEGTYSLVLVAQGLSTSAGASADKAGQVERFEFGVTLVR